MHPFAIQHPSGQKSGGNCGAWNEVNAGDEIIYLIDGRIGTLDECLSDGDAFVTWEDGSFGTVKWHHLAPRDKVIIEGNSWRAKDR